MYAILLGPPGAGKGTQATLVCAKTGWVHVASGDLFREARQADTKLGHLIRSYYDKGALVPDDVTIRMVLERILQPDCQKGCLLDGFPRTIEQARASDAALESRSLRVERVVSITVSNKELLRRLGGRWLCKVCSRPYHVVSAPPKQARICDSCGGDLYQRPDDTEKTAKTRLEVYFRQTLPLTDYYEDQGKLTEVNGEQPVEAVTRAIVDALLLSSSPQTQGAA